MCDYTIIGTLNLHFSITIISVRHLFLLLVFGAKSQESVINSIK